MILTTAHVTVVLTKSNDHKPALEDGAAPAVPCDAAWLPASKVSLKNPRPYLTRCRFQESPKLFVIRPLDEKNTGN